jgi:putative endonuclease
MSMSLRSRSNKFFVYILRCSDGTLYTGHAHDIDARLKLHNAGKGAKYVRGRTPASIVYSKGYKDRSLAAKEEYRIKTLTRLEKEELVKCGCVSSARRRISHGGSSRDRI